jgi:hypothetical protein
MSPIKLSKSSSISNSSPSDPMPMDKISLPSDETDKISSSLTGFEVEGVSKLI